ncbi:hypothetical protein HQ586_04325 [Candidatus Bathyarchaeota archaeon]|nr:hypothetical protein [Candidatus Bathyarchaeota archaeon]
MKAVQVVGVLITLVQLGSVVGFGLSLHTMAGVVMGTISGGEMGIEMNVDELGGPGSMELNLSPQNPGFLEATATFEIMILDDLGTPLGTDYETVILKPGDSQPVNLRLEISASDIMRIVEGMETSFEVTISLRTLYDLVGITNTIKLEVSETI